VKYQLEMRFCENKAHLQQNNYFAEHLIKATKARKLRPYRHEENALKEMSMTDFLAILRIPYEDEGLSEEEMALGFSGDDDDGGSEGDFGGAAAVK
jgi:hypothetical protein